MELKDFETAINVLVAGGSKLRASLIHSTKLHVVYGVPVVDAVKGSGCSGLTDEVNRNSVYVLKNRINKALELIKSECDTIDAQS